MQDKSVCPMCKIKMVDKDTAYVCPKCLLQINKT